MEISPQLAQEIVSNMQEILKQELNYIRTDGTIIASTDPTRISTFHEGSIIVVRNKKQLIITEDDQFKGVKKGINLPVFFNNEIVGVIGITGNKDDVLPYGKILQKMSELLIKEAYIQEIDFQQSNNERLLIESILNYNNSSILNSSKISNFDVSLDRMILVGHIHNKEKISIIRSYMNEWRSKGIIELHTILNDEIILFIKYSKRTISDIKNSIAQLDNVLNNVISWGFGTRAYSYTTLQDSYHNANIVINWGEKIQNQMIGFSDDIPLSIILSEIPEKKVDYYLSVLFKNVKTNQLEEIEKIINLYGIHNGSINQCAEALFIHKNTLQYKLKKIKNDTGYDPRNPNDFLTLKLGTLLYKLYRC